MNLQEEILADVRHYWRSRAILTAAELDCFTRLHREAMGAPELAARIGSDVRTTTRLLDCLVTFGLLKKEAGLYRTTEGGSLLSTGHPKSVRPLVLHLNRLWKSWSHLTETVARGKNPHLSPVTEEGGASLEAFIGGMYVVGRDAAAEIAGACRPDRFERLLDIGGGPGTYTMAFLRRNPELRAVLFDLPEVIPMAEAWLRAEGLIDRVELAPGDFYADELPGGCDAALLSAIIHQNGPEQNLDLFRKVHRALVPGGTLIIRDHVMDEDRTGPPAGTLFALNMLVATEAGDTYTFPEIRQLLLEAGFREVELSRRGERMDCLVEATKGR
jgi:SAM-dependent methyltransferase